MRGQTRRQTLHLLVALAVTLAFMGVFSSSALAHEEDHVHPQGPSPVDAVIVPYDWEFKPEGLSNGDTFRLLIVTCGTHDGLETDIEHYNHFVQDDVRDASGALAEYADQFRVLGSTTDIDARDNTFTNQLVYGDGAAIYWAKGSRVADDYKSFYDGTWENTDPGRLADGTLTDFAPDDYIFTGTKADGTAAKNPLGGDPAAGEAGLNVQLAFPGHGIGLSNHCYGTGVTPLRFYGLSGLFQVDG